MALFKNLDTQAGKPKNIRLGQIAGVTVTGVMSGYADGASLTIGAPGGTGVQAVGTIQATGGVITGVTFTNRGSGYATPPTVTAPAGTGATITAKIQKNRAGLSDNADIVFFSREEAVLADNRLKGVKAGGWYQIKERLQADGTIRYMTENLVAMDVVNATSGDNPVSDDLVAADVEMSITTQPSASSVTAPAAASFTIVAAGTSPTYQWQIRTGGVGAYANLTAAGVYAGGVTAATLNITNSTGLNGNQYRCVVSNAGATVKVTSNGARLTVA